MRHSHSFRSSDTNGRPPSCLSECIEAVQCVERPFPSVERVAETHHLSEVQLDVVDFDTLNITQDLEYVGSFPVDASSSFDQQKQLITVQLDCLKHVEGHLVLVTFFSSGLRVETPTGALLMAHLLRRIAYVSCDTEWGLFVFLAREPRQSATQCHCFRGPSCSIEKLNAMIGQLFAHTYRKAVDQRDDYNPYLQSPLSSRSPNQSGDCASRLDCDDGGYLAPRSSANSSLLTIPSRNRPEERSNIVSSPRPDRRLVRSGCLLTRFKDACVLPSQAWFRGDLPREQVLELLAQESIGAFVVRESSSCPGCLALSVKVPRFNHPTGIAHYLIESTPRGGCKLRGVDKEFSSIAALITHYSVMPDILPVALNLSRYHAHTQRSESDSDSDYQRLADCHSAQARLAAS